MKREKKEWRNERKDQRGGERKETQNKKEGRTGSMNLPQLQRRS